ATLHHVLEQRPPSRFTLATHVAQRQQRLLAVATDAERHQHREAGGLAIEPDPHHRAVEDQAHYVLTRQIALLPSRPIALHLAPDAADRVLADGAVEQGAKRATNAARVGSGKVGAGDQRLRALGQPLVGRQRLAAPFPLLAVAARDARTRHREADRPERAEQLTIPMAVPVARTPGRTVIPPASQRRCQLLLHQALDECADLLPNTGFQRIEPVRSQQWNLCLDRDILPHGVISSGGANRRSWVETSGDYATFQFPPPARRDRRRRVGVALIQLRVAI